MDQKPSKSKKILKATATVGKGVWSVSKGSAKVAGYVGKPLAKQGGKVVAKGAKATTKYTKEKVAERKELNAPISEINWYKKAAETCENIVDAVLIQKRGTSERVVKALATKFGAAGASVGVFSIASLLGTASTGTAISTLSGAAFQNAALAWIGGNVAAGGMIVFGAAIAGGAVAYFGVRHGLNKVTGKKRKKNSLDSQEKRVVDTCLFLAASFRQQQAAERPLDPISACALHNDALQILSDELDDCIAKVNHWPKIPLNRLKKEVQKLLELKQFLRKTGVSGGHKSGMIGVPVVTGVVSATIVKLIAEQLPNFSQQEELVLEALRRSNNALTQASNDQLADYVQSMEVDQIKGLTNNVKGIYHELSFQHAENTDGDQYIVELFERTNQPGADVRVINTETGVITEVQLKATNYEAYVRAHNAIYEDIEVFATSEVAEGNSDIASSGFSNSEITGETEAILGTLGSKGDVDVLDSMGVAGMIILAKNAGAFLKGEKVSDKRKSQMIQDGVVAASVAGLTTLIF